MTTKSSQFQCPHCGRPLKIIPLRSGGHNGRHSTMDSTAATTAPPGGWFSSFWYFMWGRTRPAEFEPGTGPMEPVVIRVQHISDDGRHWLLEELDERITLVNLQNVAHQVETLGRQWSRPQLCRWAGLSQNRYHVLSAEMRRLNYLHVTTANRSILSLRGRAFLRSVLAHK